MKNKYTLIVFLLIISRSTSGQNSSVRGAVTDSSKNEPVALASVAVLREKDSVLASFTRTDKQGKFEIKGLKKGEYILLVTYPKYVDFVDTFSLDANQSRDLSSVFLTETAKLLNEIVIKKPSILIKGDTTEYDASSYKVRENASAEDLLKELPGIQVDKDGKIIAQGKQVKKILVDGDEFFSDDPTVATKNLRADAISKVQVFDKKSDQAAFTGIDDGQEQKTINLKLKESAKKGYFGKASVAGLDKYYNATGMLNAFKSKRKFSVFGIASSTSSTGLSGGDQYSLGFSGGGGSFMVMGGGVGFAMAAPSGTSGGIDPGSNYGGGLPESIKAGAHYSDKWNSSKNSAGGNYLFNKLNLRSGGSTYSENTLLDSVYYVRSGTAAHSSQLQHGFDGDMQITLDSTSQLTVRSSGKIQASDNFEKRNSASLAEDFKTVNSSDGTTSNHSNSSSMNNSAFFRKRFKKKGRTISINFSQSLSDSKDEGLLDNVSRFFDEDGAQIKEQRTDQNKVNTATNNVWDTRISFTNPLGKQSYIEMNYSFSHNNNNKKRLSFDKDAEGKYNILVDSLSSDFQYIYNTNSGGLNYRFNGKKINFSAGGSVSRTGFDQEDRINDSHRAYSYTNLFPRANIRFRVRSASSISFSYSGSTSQPTIDQVQPLKNNDNPLDIVVGNPDLKQSFSNNFNFDYSSFQMMKERYFFIGGNYATTMNQISSSFIIDSLGRRVTQYINVNGNNSFSAFGNFNSKIGKSGWKLQLAPSISISNTTNLVNGLQNKNTNFSYNQTVEFSKNVTDKYDIDFSYGPVFTSSKSSISSAASRKYWTQNFSLNTRYTFPGKIDLGTDITFEFREKLDASDVNNQVILWNAYAEKRFFKKEQLILRFSINDILDQNKGYSRTIQPNSIVESQYLTFRRYGLITIAYNFNTTGTR